MPTDGNGRPQGGFKLAKIEELQELESGTYWPQLRPYFLKPEYYRIRYSVLGRPDPEHSDATSVSVRGASRLGELDLAFVSDRIATRMSITGSGLPDYCLTIFGEGQLVYSAEGNASHSLDRDSGLIYRGSPDTALTSTGAQERLAIWIPQASLTRRLSALLDAPVSGDPVFQPVFRWDARGLEPLRHLVALLMHELQAAAPSLLGSKAASRFFVDLLIYTMLKSLPHSHSGEVEQPHAVATPGTLRRAEAYIRAHVEEPIALHEVAAAANCSVRSLQLAFRSFRNTTPLLAIRRFRLEAAREALRSGDAGGTITEVALRFGFANPGRFTRHYKEAFGETPAEAMGRRRP
jgi:AraC-like DNA-binding protein